MSAGRSVALAGLGVAAAAAFAARAWIETRPIAASFSSLDLFQFFYPAHSYAGSELAAGRLPLWNPYPGLGVNEVAEPGLGLFYPPNLLFVLLPTAWALEVFTTLHIVLGAAGGYLLCRAVGLGAVSAAVAAVVLATGAPLRMLTGWPTILATFVWCPVACVAALRLAATPGPRAALGLGVVLGLQTLAGYFQLHLYTLPCIALFAAARAPGGLPARARVAGWLIVAEAIALGLAAIQVLPSMAAIGETVRNPAVMEPWFYELLPVRPADYVSGLAAPGLDARAPVYAGVLAPLLGLAALLRPGVGTGLRVPATILTATAVVLSLGSATPIYPLLWRLPIAHWLTGPYKWTYFAGLGLALLAAVGAEAVGGRQGLGLRTRIAWGVLGAGLLAVLPFPRIERLVGAAALTAGVLGGRLGGPAAALLPVAVGVAALVGVVERGMRPKDDPDFFTRYHPAFAAIAARGDDGRAFMSLPPLSFSLRQADLERVRVLNAYESMMTLRTLRLLQAVQQAMGRPAERPRALGTLRAVGVRYVLAGHDRSEWLATHRLARIFASPAADVWEDSAALPRVYLARTIVTVPVAEALARVGGPDVASGSAAVLEVEEGSPPRAAGSGQATLVRDMPTEVRVAVEATGPGVLVLLDAWSPDWRATVDGAPAMIRHANYLGRAVEVPAGRHEVVFRFVPRAFHLGAALTALTLLGCGVLAWRGARAEPSGRYSDAAGTVTTA